MKLKINIKNLSKKFDEKVIFKNLNLKIFQSESLAIIGQSGSGKSVLTKCITGLLRFEKGEIFFDNDYEISELDNYNLLKHTAKFGFLFQNAALFDSLTVKENILFKLNSSNYEEILNKVGLDKSISNKYPAELSVGVQKRVGLARAIISKPEILIFDEPTTGLDPIMAYQINKLLKKLVVDYKLTTITITHDMESVYEFADKVAFIDQGSISWYGKIGQINLNKNKQLFNFINGIN
tara:strand:- start:9248 stop:9958 length:711 start_codon:yes stop_codon:yes gene_type:complete